MTLVPIYLTIALYACSVCLYLFWLLRTTKNTACIARTSLTLACVVHQVALVHRYVAFGHFHITSMHDALSICALAIVVSYLFIEYRHRVTALGPFVTPIVLVMLLASEILIPDETNFIQDLLSIWLYIHTLLAIFSYGLFTISGGTSTLYLLLSHLLKSKSPNPLLNKFPSLERLDSISKRCLNAGFPLLSISLITGFLIAYRQLENIFIGEPKLISSALLWLIYAVLLHGRLVFGWQGKRAAILSIAGIVVLMFGFFGINLWFPGFHTFK